ncbi:hypothetical protein OUZ56_030656 [Daphnia magna]|uniref:Uncharacterized protein n=1 Tax=Daphnia magna TaxID=35525 RepID=A0ABQ9ZRY7_9CRUS|nr:hypothetical protein OUZ56_030656 [Daphnia magna]
MKAQALTEATNQSMKTWYESKFDQSPTTPSYGYVTSSSTSASAGMWKKLKDS